MNGIGLNLGTGETKTNKVSPLIEGQVGELVVAKGVGEVLGVVLLNDIVIVGKVLEHLDEVVSALGNQAVVLKPGEELGLIVSTVVHVASNGDGSLLVCGFVTEGKGRVSVI